MIRLSLICSLLLLSFAGSASAMVRLPENPAPVAGNPADRLLSLPIEDSIYDGARQCTPKARGPGCSRCSAGSRPTRAASSGAPTAVRSGARARRRCTPRTARSTGTWTSRTAPTGAAAERLIRLLLAPDAAGNPQALARRMGVEELIWDCGYWGAGMTEFSPYQRLLRQARQAQAQESTTTIAHRDHVHIGMTRRGAAARTSFWSRGR